MKALWAREADVVAMDSKRTKQCDAGGDSCCGTVADDMVGGGDEEMEEGDVGALILKSEKEHTRPFLLAHDRTLIPLANDSASHSHPFIHLAHDPAPHSHPPAHNLEYLE